MEAVDIFGSSVEMAAVGATLDGFLKLLSTEDVLSCEAIDVFVFDSGGGVGSDDRAYPGKWGFNRG